MTTHAAPVDVDVLRDEIQKTYTDVSTDPERDFIFPTGRAWAQELGYPEPELAPRARRDGRELRRRGQPLGARARSSPATVVLDLGCGAGTDLLIAAQMTGRARPRRSAST